LRRYRHDVPVVICSLSDSAEVRHAARQVGAAAFVSKFDVLDELPRIIKTVGHEARAHAA
jgi:DNA-binding NarL/FixJ family response regulator